MYDLNSCTYTISVTSPASVTLLSLTLSQKNKHKRSRAVWKFQNMIHVHALALEALILKPLNAHECTIFTRGRINLMSLAGKTPVHSLHLKWMLRGLMFFFFPSTPHGDVHSQQSSLWGAKPL